MRLKKINIRSDRDDSRWIDAFVRAVIVLLDRCHIDRLRNTRHLVEFQKVVGEIGIVDDPADVALEVADIDRVEAHKRGEQAPVGFRQPVTGQVSAGTEKIVETLPMRRLGTTAEVADVIYFLCSQGSTYVTGTEIEINGGQHI